jgi:hypothetical protein
VPRRPDTPCAGGCGKLLWGGRGALPAGQRTCRPCRSLSRSQSCASCGRAFDAQVPGRYRRRTCSEACHKARLGKNFRELAAVPPKSGPCSDCGRPTAREGNQYGRVCPDCSSIRRKARNRRKNAVRRGAKAIGYRLTLTELGDRDGWNCHLCNRRVGRAYRHPHPRSGTFDHLIPVADGGTDAPENLRLAHRSCNVRRGTGGVAQLLLVG